MHPGGEWGGGRDTSTNGTCGAQCLSTFLSTAFLLTRAIRGIPVEPCSRPFPAAALHVHRASLIRVGRDSVRTRESGFLQFPADFRALLQILPREVPVPLYLMASVGGQLAASSVVVQGLFRIEQKVLSTASSSQADHPSSLLHAITLYFYFL